MRGHRDGWAAWAERLSTCADLGPYLNSVPWSCFLFPAAAATTALAAAAGASGRKAEAGVEAMPPAMEEDEARARPENQEDVEAGEVMIAAAAGSAARLTARSSRVVDGWSWTWALDRAVTTTVHKTGG
jgi:hypothetical protein